MRIVNKSRATASYVVKRNGAYRINGSRVSLDSVVYAFRDGQSPESIQISFPALTLEQIYGTIAFYLRHRQAVRGHCSIATNTFGYRPSPLGFIPRTCRSSRRRLHY